jgi:hypothetical protein
MKLSIHSAATGDREELRTLLIDVADQLAESNCRILESKLPWDGQPMLLADSELHPVLVSFDPEQGQSALLSGLQGAEQLAIALPWVNQVYEELQKQQKPPRLVIVSKEVPAGAETILSSCPSLRFFTYRLLSVNGETGILLEPVARPAPVPARPAHVDVAGQTRLKPAQMPPSPVTGLPSLSEEEAAFFQQL